MMMIIALGKSLMVELSLHIYIIHSERRMQHFRNWTGAFLPPTQN